MTPGDAIAWYVAFVMSTTAHEAAHALVAYLGGDLTAYEGGQVSLNPVPHMQREPVGMIAMPLVSLYLAGWAFGWASTPFDPQWEARYPRRAAWMAAAGPAANLLIAALALVALRVGLAAEVFQLHDFPSFSYLVVADAPFVENVGRFLSILVVLNAILFAFNLLPIPPLDGASVLGLILPAHVVGHFKAGLMGGGVASLLFLVVFFTFPNWAIRPIWGTILTLLGYPV